MLENKNVRCSSRTQSSHVVYNINVLISSLILSGRLSELPEMCTLGIMLMTNKVTLIYNTSNLTLNICVNILFVKH